MYGNVLTKQQLIALSAGLGLQKPAIYLQACPQCLIYHHGTYVTKTRSLGYQFKRYGVMLPMV